METATLSLAEKAHLELRRDILRGELLPGSPLRLVELTARYDMGFSPLREALNRLQAERLVTSAPMRGFRVAPLSAAEFEDALATRLIVETEALRGAIRNGGADWAEGVTRALDALRDAAQDAEIWVLEARHHRFHRALLDGCGSPWLLEFFERLYNATERYRLPVLLAEGAPARDILGEHAAIADAVLAREADRAIALLRAHYLRTAEIIRPRLATPPAAPKRRRG